MEVYLQLHVDTNGDGLADDNEFRTLVAIVKKGKVPVTGMGVM